MHAFIDLLARIGPTLQKHRKAVSVGASLTLHLLVVLAFLLPKPSGLASIGTTGEGAMDGAGFAVTLVAAKDTPEIAAFVPPRETVPPVADADAVMPVQPPVDSQPVTPTSPTDQPKTTATKTVEAGAGATGQSGAASGDLWSAIAPCWNRIADKETLPATLKVSFSATGSLSAPPVIERDPSVPITDQSLRSEAKAIAALAQCGAYAMAQGQQDIEVKFPKPQ